MVRKFLIFFGPPGSGKGTQAEMLGKKIKMICISTGALLRNEINQKTALGQLVEPIVKNGRLVDDETVMRILEKRLNAEDVIGGAIFDGRPGKFFFARPAIEKHSYVNRFQDAPLLIRSPSVAV